MSMAGKYIAIDGSRIRWRIHTSSARRIRLKSIPGYSLLSPLSFHEAYRTQKLVSSNYLLINPDESIDLTTNGLLLQKDSANDSISLHDLFQSIAQLYLYLRIHSLQYDLQSANSVRSVRTFERINKDIVGINGKISHVTTPAYIWNTTLSIEDVVQSDKLALKKSPIPIYEEILLDAINELMMNRFRTGVLYSAISVESMLRLRWESEHKSLLKRKVGRYPWINHSNQSDDLFNLIKKNDKFDSLLKEYPLYIRGKSLVEENKGLYDRALKLYTTRNGLVHRGDLTDKDQKKTYNLDKSGCSAAIIVAVELFRWMGISSFDRFLEQGLKTLKSNQ